MNDTKHLGLPIEYKQMPEYFDAHNINEKTELTNAVIDTLLSESNVKTVLDMTCGTGAQVFYLADRGYDIVGSDFSPALLERARQKAKLMNREIKFVDGDIRTVQLGQFDSVISIFNAIGHLVKSDFEKALQNIHSNLSENGIYIFDIFNLQSITDDIIDDFAMDIEKEIRGVNIRDEQYSEIDKKSGLLTSHDRYTMTKEDQTLEIIENTFSLQIYTAEELRHLLVNNGFKVIKQVDLQGNTFKPESSLNIMTVAQKV